MLHNPYPIYRRFLEQGPIRYVDYGSGMWAVFSHAVCSTSIREPLLSSKRTAALLRDLPAERKTEFAELVRCVDRDVLRPVVELNFGAEANYELRPLPLIDVYLDQISLPRSRNTGGEKVLASA